MALGQNIRARRSAAGLTLDQLSERSGVDVGTISALENRDSKRSVYAAAIARGLGISVDELLGGAQADNADFQISLDTNPDYPSIRRVQFKLSAGASGFGVEYLDDDDAPIVFRKEWFTNNGFEPRKLFATRVANGSMEPGLYDGDTVIVNTGQTNPKDGVVFAVNYEGELTVKRLIRDSGEWWLSSDNPDQRRFPRKRCDENSFIIGEIVHKQSERI